MYVCNNIVYMLSLNKNTIINLPEQQKKTTCTVTIKIILCHFGLKVLNHYVR